MNTKKATPADASTERPQAVASVLATGSDSGLFEVGETLKCLQYVERKDGRSSIRPGDLVKVIQAFSFIFEGKQCEDITVQRGHDMPIAVMVEPERFVRVSFAERLR